MTELICKHFQSLPNSSRLTGLKYPDPLNILASTMKHQREIPGPTAQSKELCYMKSSVLLYGAI